MLEYEFSRTMTAPPYDINFCLPVQELESDRIKLTPFVPALHSDVFHAASLSHPELFTWMAMGPFATSADFSAWVERVIRQDSSRTLFAILNKSADGSEELAGLTGLLNADPANLSVEIGYVWTLPAFQRTYVTTHGVGLLLRWCFDDARLRRVQWQANVENQRSWRAAEKNGFRREMVKRWERAMPPGKPAVKTRETDPRSEYGGRHTIMLAICWDHWRETKELVRQRMERQ